MIQCSHKDINMVSYAIVTTQDKIISMLVRIYMQSTCTDQQFVRGKNIGFRNKRTSTQILRYK